MKYYAYFLVDKGSKGITEDWPTCQALTKGQVARYKSFKNKDDAQKWLDSGASYEKPIPEKGIYFDAGTGRGDGVEISVTDERGEDLLYLLMPKKELNEFGKHLLPDGKTNNYGELNALFYALQIALLEEANTIFGDSKLVIDFWSKGNISLEDSETRSLAITVAQLREEFELKGGKIKRISGADNPADLGFH